MENWGLIGHEVDNLINETDVDLLDKMSVTFIITHELCHQWFGNIVTPKWWSIIWVSEGFAEFFGYYILDKVSEINVHSNVAASS